MSSNNASSTVTYTSVSFDSNGPSSWGIPLENAGEILDMDPYKEIAPKQGLGHHPLSLPLPDPIGVGCAFSMFRVGCNHMLKLASPMLRSPGFIADLGSMEDDTDKNFYWGAKEDESLRILTRWQFEEKRERCYTTTTRLTFSLVTFLSDSLLRRALKTVRLEPPMPASMEARITKHAAAPIPPTNLTYDQVPLGHRATMIHMRDDIPEEDMPPQRRFIVTAPPPGYDVAESSAVAAARAPRGQYDFVDAVEARQGLIRSPGHDTRTIARRVSELRDVEDFRLEIDVVMKLAEATRAEDDAVRQIMRTQVLEVRESICLEAYTKRFQEFRLDAAPNFLLMDTRRLDKYIGVLPDFVNILGCQCLQGPKTFVFAIDVGPTTDWIQKLRTYGGKA
ncbi:hypothetical protein Tco_0039525 [Tanacetum coccineum]